MGFSCDYARHPILEQGNIRMHCADKYAETIDGRTNYQDANGLLQNAKRVLHHIAWRWR